MEVLGIMALLKALKRITHPNTYIKESCSVRCLMAFSLLPNLPQELGIQTSYLKKHKIQWVVMMPKSKDNIFTVKIILNKV